MFIPFSALALFAQGVILPIFVLIVWRKLSVFKFDVTRVRLGMLLGTAAVLLMVVFLGILSSKIHVWLLFEYGYDFHVRRFQYEISSFVSWVALPWLVVLISYAATIGTYKAVFRFLNLPVELINLVLLMAKWVFLPLGAIVASVSIVYLAIFINQIIFLQR